MKNLKKFINSFNKKSDRGITLIALIITIIILVILAAVSIRAVTNMGIVGHAINGTQKYAEGAVAENRMFGDVGSLIDNTVSKIKEIQSGEGIALNKSKMGLQLINGQTVSEKLTATLLKIEGEIEWTSSNQEIATVGNDGTVTAVAVGKTTITAKVTSNKKKYSASCEVEVTTEPVTNVELSANTGTLDIGQTLTLTATVTPENASNKGVTWSSSDTSVATVENGIVTAVAAGSTIITATAADGSEYNATCTITVNPKLVSNITLNESSKTLNVGDTLTLTATVTPNDATNKNVTWSSSDTSVATVTNGVVTAKAAGSSTITATAVDGSGKYATCSITVNNISNDDLEVGKYFRLTPDASSYKITTSLSGYDQNQTINPSELNLWRVIGVNNDGTVDAVSEYTSSTSVYFGKKDGYKKFIGSMQTIASQYSKEGYTVATRMVGYDEQNYTIYDELDILTDTPANSAPSFTTPSPTSGTGNEYADGLKGDTLYLRDYILINNVYGSLIANSVGTNSPSEYWLTSRKHYGYNMSGNATISCMARLISTSGSITGTSFFSKDWTQGDRTANHRENTYSASLRPIITLRADVLTDGGNGTIGEPYLLTK